MSKQIKLNQNEIARFWSNVDKRGENECWNWQKSLTESGYGQFRASFFSRNQYRAHRVAYTIVNGAIPENMLVMHLCDNRRCCNPAHLRLGTNDENMQDMVSKGRSPLGERNVSRAHPEKLVHQNGESNGMAKLNDAKVKEIRNLKSQGWKTRHIAKRFSVSDATISDIIHGRSWTHVK